jgi:hypothetical protein
LKSKSGKDVLEGFKKIFENTVRRPLKLQTDDGKEFLAGVVQKYLKEEGIHFFTLKSVSFYDKEMQLVSKELTEEFWKVEKVLKERRFRGRKQYFVKWEGYPESSNSWVDEKEVKRL